MAPDLEQLFERNTLVRPSDDSRNLVHLVRALATLTGLDDIAPTPPLRLKIEQVLHLPPVHSRMRRDAFTLLPSPIANATYASWSRGYGPGAGYNSIAHAIDQIIERVATARQPTYTHLYIPDID